MQVIIECYNYVRSDFMFIITWVLIATIVYKLYRFWTVKRIEHNLDHTIFNPRILNINATNEPGTVAPTYPNLWYPVIQSNELKAGHLKPLYVLEKDLVVFRTTSGKVHVLDAFCPHLGAHLGVGGSVVGEEIRCPFHCWQFNGQGVCTRVPGLKENCLPKVEIKTWKCTEMNGWVFVWHHQNDQMPNWTPLRFDEIKDSLKCGEVEYRQNGHLMDILSNTADLDHFQKIHSMSGIISPMQVLMKTKYYNFISSILRIDYQAKWCCGKDQDKHIAYIEFVTTPVMFGYRLTMMATLSKVKLCPPVFYFTNTLIWFNLSFYIVSALVPKTPLRHRFIHTIYPGPGFASKLFARIAFFSLVPSTETDQIIFNNKKFLNNPCFTSMDKTLVKFFRWFEENFQQV